MAPFVAPGTRAACAARRRCDNRAMELVFGVPALFALVVGLVAVRRVIARRKLSLQAYTHTRDQRLRKSRPKDMRSKRSEMRALDNPTTMMGEITTKPGKRRRPERH
jgi:hypothetical protein